MGAYGVLQKKQKGDKVLRMLFYYPNGVYGKTFRVLAAFEREDW
jgi:hypothetical protein